MTPNFALLLSVEGIVLLHRVQDGWHRAGHVPLDASDLSAEMAVLRDKAGDLADGDVHTKLVLPNDQIRFLTIETARTSLDDIHAAITSATPLALDEMVIDFDRSGGRTHIAAVAKQTLIEAETFAQEHGFAPVSFAANAEAYTFSGEVFFGPTNYARETLNIGADMKRDEMATVETGIVAVDTPDLETSITAVSKVKTPEVLPDENADQDSDTEIDVPFFASRNRSTADATEPSIDTPIARFNRSGQSEDTKEFLPTAETNAPAVPSPVLAPIARREQPSDNTKKPSTPILSSFRKKDRSASAAPTSPVDLALAKGIAKADTRSGTPYLGLAMTAALVAVIAIVGVWASNQMEGGVAGLLEVDPGLQDDGTEIATAPIIVAPPTEAAETETAQAPQVEEETPPTPIVTAIPGRVLGPADAARIYAATGVWQRAPRLPGMPEPASVTTPEGIHVFDVVAPVQDIAKPGTPDITVLSHDLPILTPLSPPPANRPLPRDEDGFIRASANGTVLPTGVWIYGRAPAKRPPLRPTDEPVGLDDASVPTVQEDIVTSLQLTAFTADADLPPTRAFIAPALSQPLPVARPSAEAPQWLPATKALISAPATAPAAVGPTVTDVLAAVPETPANVAPNAPDTTVATAPEAAPNQQSPLQSVAALADSPLDTPVPASTEADLFDAPAGFVEVIQGRPAIVPPLRPGTPEVAPETDVAEAPTDAEAGPEITATDEGIFQDPSLAEFRPRGRPANLLPPSAATFEAIPTLAGFRPSLRPQGLAPALVEEPAEDQADAIIEDPAVANASDISAIVATIAAAAPPSQIVNPTRSAIVASPRPDTRPQNFARVVASAQALQQRQETRSAAASTSAAVVQQPAPATAPATGGQTAVTVARAATVDNAIRLRNMNLIGVYGKPGARRALVRMPNGRFVKVEVGSNLDGGRVTAIGDSALNFVKRGQTYALQLPAG